MAGYSRDKASWNQCGKKTGSWCLSFSFKAPGLAALEMRAVLIMKITAFAKRVSQSVSPALNPDACFSSFLISVLCGIFLFQKWEILSTLKKKKKKKPTLFRHISFFFSDYLSGIWVLSLGQEKLLLLFHWYFKSQISF